MPVQRKVFSIEQYASRHEGLQVAGVPSRDGATRTARTQADPDESRLTQQAAERIRNDIAGFGRSLIGGDRMVRAKRELQAITAGTQSATHTILQAAEAIDEAANTLSAALKSSHEQELAQDIRDAVTQILEACNFHDMTGQRVAHVTATLAFIEQQAARMTETRDGGPRQGGGADADGEGHGHFLRGPKLAGDNGHATQAEIDRMFRCA
ncbi:MAG: hypothetical protein J0H89_04595 [Rhizobiales bacterium]|nr:hypothetical protein [Hyphomicrobiales bacterium]